jgi:hypothetical protein
LEEEADDVKERFAELIAYDQKLYQASNLIFERQSRDLLQLVMKDYPNRFSTLNVENIWQKLSELMLSQGEKAAYKPNAHNILRKLKGLFN